MLKRTWRFGAVAILLGTAAAGTATAQSMPDDMREGLKRKYDILQQQADTARIQAESERTRVNAEISRSNAQTSSSSGGGNTFASFAGYFLPEDHDSLGRLNPPTYRLGNGVVLQMTGIFWPDALTVCVANCQ